MKTLMSGACEYGTAGLGALIAETASADRNPTLGVVPAMKAVELGTEALSERCQT